MNYTPRNNEQFEGYVLEILSKSERWITTQQISAHFPFWSDRHVVFRLKKMAQEQKIAGIKVLLAYERHERFMVPTWQWKTESPAFGKGLRDYATARR